MKIILPALGKLECSFYLSIINNDDKDYFSTITLTNSSEADSSFVSCADCVDRNTGVHSICINSDIEHTQAAVTNKGVIKVQLIHVGFRDGVSSTGQCNSTVAKHCCVAWSRCKICHCWAIYERKD